MAALSTYYANKIIDHMLRGQSFSPPATVYLACFTTGTAGLSTNSPTNEVSTSGTSYARQALTLDAASSGATSNSGQVSFPQATAGYGAQVTHVAIVDSALPNTNWGTNVNVLAFAALATAKSVDQNDILRFDIGELDFTLA